MHDIDDDLRSATARRPLRIALRGSLGVVAGWTLLVLGVALLPLPGPGSLVVLAGIRVLVPHHAWAARIHDDTRDRLVRASAAGVATWPRVALSALGPMWLAGLTAAYATDLQLGQLSVVGLGPGLPLRSSTTTAGLTVSTLAAAVLVLVAVHRWGPHRQAAPQPLTPATGTAQPAPAPHPGRSWLQPCSSA